MAAGGSSSKDERFLDMEKLISTIADADHRPQQANYKKKMPKVPAWIREFRPEKAVYYFDPQVVSLGPFHQRSEELKLTAFRKCVESVAHRRNCSKDDALWLLYNEANKVIVEAKECYPDDVIVGLGPEAFTCMMMVDGCFILHFITCANNNNLDSEVSEGNVPIIIRDMFKLENQIPFAVLHALFALTIAGDPTGEILKFMHNRVVLPNFYRLRGRQGYYLSRSELSGGDVSRVAHLLDLLLRVTMLGDGPSVWDTGNGPSDLEIGGCLSREHELYQFGSVMELKDEGIRFKYSRRVHLTDIKFEPHSFFPEILTPKIVITEGTICYVMNMVAFEQNFSSRRDRSITSYICFLNSIINNAADVKELRSRGILYHALGSDKEVAELLNHWPVEAMGDLEVYTEVSDYIGKHRRKRWKISIARFLQTHLRSPWSAASFAAAVALLLLALLQTIFTIKH